MQLNEMQSLCHERSKTGGWWNYLYEVAKFVPIPHPIWDRLIAHFIATKISLIHSEVSEGLEAFRKDLKDDHLHHRDGLECELADAVIRCFDLAEHMNYDLQSTIMEKLDYNDQRSDHKPEARAAKHGKKF